MALSGQVETGGYSFGSNGTRTVILKWTGRQNNDDKLKNQTVISWQIVGGGTYTGDPVVCELRATIDGNVVFYRDATSGNKTNCSIGQVLASGNKTISHNSDGTKSISISVEAGIYQWAINRSGSGTFTLNTIPRESSLSLSASSVNIGDSITANISRASSSFTHDVEFYINSTYYKKYTGVGTSQSYKIPTDWCGAMPSSTNCTAYCRITTYNGDKSVGGQVKKSFTVNVPGNIKPTIGTIKLTPATINNQSILVKGKNKLTVAASDCSAGTGSNIKSYAFSGPSISKTISSTSSSASTSVSFVTDVSSFTNEETTLTYKVTVTDQRGRTASKTNTIKCYNYYSPSFSKFNIYRANSDGSANANGAYIQCDYIEKHASVNSTNSVTVTAYYNNGNTTKTESGSNGKVLINLNGDTNTTYKVYLKIGDAYGGSDSSSTISVFGQFRILNITSDGTGFAIGKMAEEKNLFECATNAKFYGSFIVNGKTLLDWTHPVGSIYQSTVSTSPEELFGGTWKQLNGKFLLASNSTYAAGSTGGEATHTLTINEMPSHEGHLETNSSNWNGNNNLFLPSTVLTSYTSGPRGWVTQSSNEVVPAGESKGGGQAHNNMPPYLAVYMWERTA